MAAATEPWWIIASAAVALHGADPGPIGDVDVLMGLRDAEALCAARGIVPAAGMPDDRFRSALFARLGGAALPIEIMAGFEVRQADGWRPIRPVTRQRVVVRGGGVYVPDRVELAALIRSFGRPKDIVRAALLDPGE